MVVNFEGKGLANFLKSQVDHAKAQTQGEAKRTQEEVAKQKATAETKCQGQD